MESKTYMENIGKKFTEAKLKLTEMEEGFEKELKHKLEELQDLAIDKLTKSISK